MHVIFSWVKLCYMTVVSLYIREHTLMVWLRKPNGTCMFVKWENPFLAWPPVWKLLFPSKRAECNRSMVIIKIRAKDRARHSWEPENTELFLIHRCRQSWVPVDKRSFHSSDTELVTHILQRVVKGSRDLLGILLVKQLCIYHEFISRAWNISSNRNNRAGLEIPVQISSGWERC